VVFVVKYFPANWYNNWRVYGYGRPPLRNWTTCLDVPAFALIHLLIPLIYVLVFVRYSRRANPSVDQQWRRLMLINLTGFVLFLSIVSAPAYTRLYAVSPPAVILLVWLVNSSPKFARGMLRLLWATVLIMAITRPLVTQLRWKAYLDLPTGRTAFFEPPVYEICKWVSERTRPGEYFFGDNQIAFSLMLRNAARIGYVLPTDYTRPEEVQDLIEGLQKFQVRLVFQYIGIDGEKAAPPTLPLAARLLTRTAAALGLDLRMYDERHPEGNHLAPLRQYVHEHYRLAQTFSDGSQIWERTR